MSWKTGALFAVLISVALALGIAAGGASMESRALSAENASPSGAMALITWLRENGASVRIAANDLTSLQGIATVIIPAPRVQQIDEAEVLALKGFVRGGGTLIYLAPRSAYGSPINRWLGIVPRGLAPVNDENAALRDPAGTTAKVTLSAGLTQGLNALRVAGDRLVEVSEGAVPVTEPAALWFKPVGAGEVWVASGPDLAENARLELLDNGAFWLNAASRGPVLFDESHHHLRASSPVKFNVLTTALQLAVLALIFIWSRAPRLGPARPTPVNTHRSSLEYVHAMGSLIAKARIDGEVVAQLRDDLRRLANERAGISLHLAHAEWARAAASAADLPLETVERVFATDEVLAVARAAAQVESKLLR